MVELAFLVGLLFQLGPSTDPKQVAAEAQKLYRAKQYASACPLFERLTELTPTRGSAWGDYGLCLAKLGNKRQEAIAASYRAISLSGSDARARKAVYYNLGQVIGEVFPSHVPGPTEEGPLAELEGLLPRCELFDSVPGCDQRAWACYNDLGAGTRLGRFGRDPRTFAKKSWPAMEWSEEPRVLLDKDVLVMSEESSESYRSGDHACFYSVGCRVVWADACGGRIGYTCNLAKGPTPHEIGQRGLSGSSECVKLPSVSGEISIR
jgi:hypothetical protein